ncbi:MAG TPA: glycosyltransferase family 2 protein [Acidisoma sp.]|uniref:glycosyltransferase family 2 protein n=1 Tax=Acidisoma sp. TaxID=1872115 RepID=UPI002B9AE101|nr:glycosyltransferase family 2 protein [Acidisoma sp.]HTI02925.1 glycosyltransferase family 2 protein [Acidisoma sp.]
MAGFGRRFLDAGYTVPKYRIEAHGRSLFSWSMLSLDQFIRGGASFAFIVRAADDASDFIAREAATVGITRFDIVELDAPTDGQATTAMQAMSVVPAQEPMLIYNIDTFVHPRALPATAVRGDGWIPCFAAEGDHWSFAAADADGRVSAVREKKRISPHATVGLYWFASFDLFRRAYDAHYVAGGTLEAGERYVAPLYSQLLSEHRPVFIHNVPVDAVIPLGVPDEVRRFEARTSADLGLRSLEVGP